MAKHTIGVATINLTGLVSQHLGDGYGSSRVVAHPELLPTVVRFCYTPKLLTIMWDIRQAEDVHLAAEKSHLSETGVIRQVDLRNANIRDA